MFVWGTPIDYTAGTMFDYKLQFSLMFFLKPEGSEKHKHSQAYHTLVKLFKVVRCKIVSVCSRVLTLVQLQQPRYLAWNESSVELFVLVPKCECVSPLARYLKTELWKRDIILWFFFLPYLKQIKRYDKWINT